MSKFPFNNPDLNFPLSEYPYNSRTEFSQVLNVTPKNYVMHGFRPGFPLQASELNEIQEMAAMESGLYMTMNYYWKDNLPGWLGTCPLWPEKVLPEVDIFGPSTNLIEKTTTSTTVKIYANKGWYNIYSRQTGFRHWVYLNTDLETQDLDPDPTNTQYIGFNISYEQVNANTDSTLYDNSSTNLVAGTPAGANRIKINILNEINGELTVTGSPNDSLQFSPIVKTLESFTGFARYLNDREVPTR